MDDLKKTISLPKSQVESLIKYYTQRVLELDRERSVAIALLNELGADTTDLASEDSASGSSLTSQSTHSEYKDSWSWMRKVKYVLKHVGHCLTTREIIEELKEIDKTIIEDPINSVSGTISNKVRAGVVFKRYQPFEGSEQYVGLLEWCGEDGEIKEEYLPE